MDGFYGRILKIDLGKRNFSIEKIEDETLASYPGGKALASFLLFSQNPAGVDPLSPDNRLIFASGPVSGGPVWGSSRYGVFTKSPQTGFYSESYAGGKTPEALDAAGFDAIVISGRSPSPIALTVSPEGAKFHDAAGMWGMDAYEAEDAMKARFSGAGGPEQKSGAVVIGPAGENLVRFAAIGNDYWRSAGRTGAGTVMGAKKLKGVLFSGGMKRPVHDLQALKDFSRKVSRESRKNPVVVEFSRHGTAKMLAPLAKIGGVPSKGWGSGEFSGWEGLTAQALHRRCDVKPRACARCFIACGRMTRALKGRHAGLELEGPEYETLFAFGGLCLIKEIEEILYLNDLCDRLGMDTISAGSLCALAIEASAKGRTDFKISYGDPDGAARLLEMIAKRQGVGDILAQGIRFAASRWGMEDMAVHVKGLELPGYDPRVLKGSALAFAVSHRGACHLRATFHSPEISGAVPRDEIEGKAALLIDYEDRMALMDCMILCRFYKEIYGWSEMSALFEMTAGVRWDESALRKKAARLADLIRRFNIREGLVPEDDRLPDRLHRERLKDGRGITRRELAFMVADYYRLRGWDKDGAPPPEGGEP
ncbi:Aldehyde:ferredoxin oxidoreductase [Candidatus Desulfarcum epimagneticum]|uniref:Aldehyde:ferredoxin oxidoreductase n=1 Tax=uncultured Desulfobacteraceae bacterium TaxID=218296 RepID=A0A484HBM2_9BACT|nr:Aldehyde:ferredoxin oxidoreductase [uncultured Desulfobacteraceae bacterium]